MIIRYLIIVYLLFSVHASFGHNNFPKLNTNEKYTSENIRDQDKNSNLAIKIASKYDYSIHLAASGEEYSLDQCLIFWRLGCLGTKVEKISISENQIQHKNSFEIEFEDYEKNQTPTAKKE